MGKGLIGNTLSGCLQDILSGRVSIDDIDTIYTGTCHTKETLTAENYKHTIEQALLTKKEDEIARENGFNYIDEMPPGKPRLEVYHRARKEIDKMLPDAMSEAQDVLLTLYESGKLFQTRYMVPEGETVMAYFIRDGEDISDKEFQCSSSHNNGLMKINGKIYCTTSGDNCFYADNNHRWCSDKVEFIASQLSLTRINYHEKNINFPRSAMLKLVFPENETEITQLCEIMKKDYFENDKQFSFDEIYKKLNEIAHERGGHTPTEIKEGVEELSLEEFSNALVDINGSVQPNKENKKNQENEGNNDPRNN